MKQKTKWYQWIPHPVVMLFIMILIASGLTYVLPSGEFDREEVNGRLKVISNSYHEVTKSPLDLMDILTAFPEGFKVASDIIFIVLICGAMFGILEKSKMVENIIGTLVNKLGANNRNFIIVLMTYIFGFLGMAVGYENNIALVPIAAVLALALGGDLVLAAGMAVGGITIGFGLSPINPYTVGTGHQIAELPLFSGFILRLALCLSALGILAWSNVRYLKLCSTDRNSALGADLDESGLQLSKPIADYQISPQDYWALFVFLLGMAGMLYGVFNYHWYLREIAGVFILITIAVGIVARISPSDFSHTLLSSVGLAAPGAFMVGYATTIKVILEKGFISDTLAYHMSGVLTEFSSYGAGLLMTLAQSVMNFMIPSGSGQALATLPIMIPVGELVGLTRQSTILAFQIGDGVTNLVNPTLGGLIAMLSLCRVPFDRWLRFIGPLIWKIMVLSWLFLLFSIVIEWGPA